MLWLCMLEMRSSHPFISLCAAAAAAAAAAVYTSLPIDFPLTLREVSVLTDTLLGSPCATAAITVAVTTAAAAATLYTSSLFFIFPFSFYLHEDFFYLDP